MTYPVLILILHLLALVFQRTVQIRNQSSMSMTRLYSDHEEANKLVTRRNSILLTAMGASLFAAVVFYIITFSPAPRNSFLTSDFAVSIAEATKLGDTTYVLMMLMALVLGGLSSLVGRQLSLQSKETLAILEANFLEERVNIDHIMLIEGRLSEMDDVIKRLVTEENERMRAEVMRNIQ